jgi:cell division control protein 6
MLHPCHPAIGTTDEEPVSGFGLTITGILDNGITTHVVLHASVQRNVIRKTPLMLPTKIGLQLNQNSNLEFKFPSQKQQQDWGVPITRVEKNARNRRGVKNIMGWSSTDAIGEKKMIVNFLEEECRRQSLFVDEGVLEPDWHPEGIKHRDGELMLMSRLFLPLLDNPFSRSQKIVIQGNVGLGKTIITQSFAKMMLASAKKRNINLKYIHVNCRLDRTNFKVMATILKGLGVNIPKRGFSAEELLEALKQWLVSNEVHLVLTLDETNYLESHNHTRSFDLLYSLTRLNDSNMGAKHHLSLIIIVRHLSMLSGLDGSTLSTLQGNVITVKPYNRNQILDILMDRIFLAIKSGVVPIEIAESIADVVMNDSDIRKGLVILKNAVYEAMNHNVGFLTIEMVRSAQRNTIPSIQDQALSCLGLQDLIILDAIAQALQTHHSIKVQTMQFRPIYEELCIKFGQIPRSTTQVWEYLQNLKNLGVVKITVGSKKTRGRTSYIYINDIPLNTLREELAVQIDSRLQQDICAGISGDDNCV